jgi:ribokinase
MPMGVPSPIIVVGSINTDLVIRGPRLPAPGETVLGGEFYQAAGGKGANQAVAAARSARQPVTFVGAVGDDALGHEALERLRCENLVCDYVRTVRGQPTGVALILVDEQGQNLISVAAGANAHLTPADLDRVPQEVFISARVFLTSLETPLETVVRGLSLARRAGLTTILNPAPARPLPDEVLTLVDVLTPNESEAETLVGGDREGTRSGRITPAECAARLVKRGCRSVIATLGEAGCLVAGRENGRVPGRAVAAVDATAAGDAFNGALAVALAEGRTLVEAARWANVAASISVTRRGAQPSLARREEIDEIARSHRDIDP